MKGKNERGEKKGKEGRKKREGGKKRGKKKRRRKEKVPQQGLNPRPSTLQPTAYSELHARTY